MGQYMSLWPEAKDNTTAIEGFKVFIKLNRHEAANRLCDVRDMMGFADEEIRVQLYRVSPCGNLLRELNRLDNDIEVIIRILMDRNIGERHDMYETVVLLEKVAASTRTLLENLVKYTNSHQPSRYVQKQARRLLKDLEVGREALLRLRLAIRPTPPIAEEFVTRPTTPFTNEEMVTRSTTPQTVNDMIRFGDPPTRAGPGFLNTCLTAIIGRQTKRSGSVAKSAGRAPPPEPKKLSKGKGAADESSKRDAWVTNHIGAARYSYCMITEWR